MTREVATAGRQARRAVSLKHEKNPTGSTRAASTIVRSDLDLVVAEQYVRQAYERAKTYKAKFGLLYVAYNVEGLIAFRRDAFAKAEERFAMANDLVPGSSEYPFLVAQLFAQYGLVEAARDTLLQESSKYFSPEFDKVRSRFQLGIENLPCAVANSPKQRDGWMKIAERVLSQSPTDRIRCPVNDDAELVVEWLPYGDNARGKCHLFCPTCGAYLNVVITAPSNIKNTNLRPLRRHR